MSSKPQLEVSTARELATAAGIPLERVETLMASGELPSIQRRFVSHRDAVAWGRKLRSAHGLTPTAGLAVTGGGAALERPELFEAHAGAPRQPALPAAISVATHVLVGAIALLITAGLGSAAVARTEAPLDPMRLVYLALPGPGGGGGGGGLKQKLPPPAAKRQGKQSMSSPVPEQRPEPKPEPPKVEPPPPETPPIVAPVTTVASDETDRAGILQKTPAETDSHGSGDNGGVGTGRGTGIGEGEGPGLGPGSGGGNGGGPYRPGSGITPPSLLQEVKPLYTDDARRRNITGDVVLEIVVRSDGHVGDVKLLQGLGYGLDQRAVDAVRQWRFSPAKRFGQPVDVLVEVAVEFRLR